MTFAVDWALKNYYLSIFLSLGVGQNIVMHSAPSWQDFYLRTLCLPDPFNLGCFALKIILA